MSRTDKDRPFWVIRHVENSRIDHDHRRGVCIEETLEYARAREGQRKTWPHWAQCHKRVRHEFYCTEQAPHRPRRRWRPSLRGLLQEELCWNQWRVPVMYTAYGTTYRTKTTHCVGPHVRYTWDETLPCVCDTWPPRPTCDPSWHAPELGYCYSHYGLRGVNKRDTVRVEYHGPERRRERDELGELAKAWNGGDLLEDWDFVNRQGRRGVRWHML